VSVVNGQDANQLTFNSAFMSRTTDTSTLGVVELGNAGTGATVSNSQREHISISSYTGKSLNSASGDKPSWSSSIVGASGDTLKARGDALTLKFQGTGGHGHTGAAGDGDQINLGTSVVGTLPLSFLASSGNISVTNLSFAGLLSGSIVTASGVTGTDAEVPEPTALVIELSNGSLSSINMIEAPSGVQLLVLRNKTGNSITIKDEDGGTAANRILTGTGANLPVADDASIWLFYSTEVSRWCVVGGSGGGGSSIAVNSFTGTTLTLGAETSQSWRYTGTTQSLSSFDLSSAVEGTRITVINIAAVVLTIPFNVTGVVYQNGTKELAQYQSVTYEYVDSLSGLVEVK
jgi:hypothetical protein